MSLFFYINTKIYRKGDFVRNRTLALLVSLLMLFSLTACVNKAPSAKEEKLNKDTTKIDRVEFKNINRDGSFVLRKQEDKIIVSKEFSEDKNAVIRQFEWYTDPLCPDCMRAHKGTEEYISKALAEGIIEIKFHSLNFLPHAIENNYSLAVSAWTIAIAEKEPDKIIEFMNKTYSDELKEKLIPESDVQKALLNYIIENKILDEHEALEIYKDLEKYEDTVNRGSVGIRKFKKWQDLSPKEEKTFFVPFIYNIKSGKALNGESEDTKTEILEPLQGYVPCAEECD